MDAIRKVKAIDRVATVSPRVHSSLICSLLPYHFKCISLLQLKDRFTAVSVLLGGDNTYCQIYNCTVNGYKIKYKFIAAICLVLLVQPRFEA